MLVTAYTSPLHDSVRFANLAHVGASVAGGLLAQQISDRIIQNSVETRLSEPKSSQADARQAMGLLIYQKEQKKSALKQAIPLSLLTLAIGQVSVWMHPSQHWGLYAPNVLAWGMNRRDLSGLLSLT